MVCWFCNLLVNNSIKVAVFPGSPHYKLLFGGMLGQELANMTRDADITAAIQVQKGLLCLS